MKYKLVKFRDGTYGARKGFPFFYEFLDIKYPLRFRWSSAYGIDTFSKGTEDQAKVAIIVFNSYYDKGTIV